MLIKVKIFNLVILFAFTMNFLSSKTIVDYLKMPSHISSLMLDFRLKSMPTEDELVDKVVKPIEKLSSRKLKRVQTTMNSPNRTTLCLEGEDILVVSRAYDDGDGVIVTVTVELPEYEISTFKCVTFFLSKKKKYIS